MAWVTAQLSWSSRSCLQRPLPPFAIAWAAARAYFRHGHWFPVQKSAVVGFTALDYGILGTALGTMAGSAAATQDDVSAASVAGGMLGFLLLFTVAACIYARFLPRAEAEPLVQY